MMLLQDQGRLGLDGIFLRFRHLVKDLMETMGLQQSYVTDVEPDSLGAYAH